MSCWLEPEHGGQTCNAEKELCSSLQENVTIVHKEELFRNKNICLGYKMMLNILII